MGCIARLCIACTILALQVIGGCLDGWKAYGESCYFVPDRRETRTAASTTCSLYQAHLAEVLNVGEEQFLSQFIMLHYKHSRDYWLGGSDSVVEGEWRWSKTGQSMNYTNWCNGEPNDRLANEDCLTAHHLSGSHFCWVDRQCTHTFPFVCQMSAHWIQFG